MMLYACNRLYLIITRDIQHDKHEIDKSIRISQKIVRMRHRQGVHTGKERRSWAKDSPGFPIDAHRFPGVPRPFTGRALRPSPGSRTVARWTGTTKFNNGTPS